MLIKELINELRKYPENQKVLIDLDGVATTEIEVHTDSGPNDGLVCIREK